MNLLNAFTASIKQAAFTKVKAVSAGRQYIRNITGSSTIARGKEYVDSATATATQGLKKMRGDADAMSDEHFEALKGTSDRARKAYQTAFKGTAKAVGGTAAAVGVGAFGISKLRD
jgi:hypothetical protein